MAEPIWTTAGRSGNVSVHCYFWDGCQIPHKDIVVQVPIARRLNFTEPKQTEHLPDYFDQMIAQIERYQPYRQQLFIAYYASLDYASHIYGTHSDEAHKETMKADVIVSDLQVVILSFCTLICLYIATFASGKSVRNDKSHRSLRSRSNGRRTRRTVLYRRMSIGLFKS